jgi:hypothetical protein
VSAAGAVLATFTIKQCVVGNASVDKLSGIGEDFQNRLPDTRED